MRIPNLGTPSKTSLVREHKTMGEFQYNFDDEDTVLIGNYEEVGTEIDEADEQHNEENSEDDEEDESPIPSKKRVSFAVPLVQSRSKQKDEMNKVHIIKCHFDKCNKSYNWRKKYGKLRLVDHAFTHVPHLKMKCNFCDYMCKGIRNIRLHHKKSHPDEQLTGFGIKRYFEIPKINVFVLFFSVVRTSKKGKDLAKVWDECFKKNRVLQHGSGTDSNLLHFSRQDKGSKRSQKSMDSGAKQKLDEARDEDMTCDDWNSFIQVNIYGKTIEGLQQQGVVLETLLNNVGCSKLWIVEGSVCTSSTPESSTYSEKRTIEPVVSLSTTLATNKLPRFSTPAVGHSKYNSAKNFTLNLAEKLSEILSDDDKTDKCLENSYQSETSREDVIQDLLEEMVQTVADVDQAPILLSTTLANIGVPRFSTPIKPQNGLDRKFTMNMTERISEIDSNYLGYEVLDDSNKILTANCEEVEMSLCENIPGVNNARTFSNTPYDDFLNIYSTPKNPKSNSSVPYQEGKRRSSRRLSTLSSLKETVKIEPAVSKSTKRSRLA
nr:hypothetical protein T07G12.9 - Caenorhabditis elegans [Caenorhabditis elegans]